MVRLPRFSVSLMLLLASFTFAQDRVIRPDGDKEKEYNRPNEQTSRDLWFRQGRTSKEAPAAEMLRRAVEQKRQQLQVRIQKARAASQASTTDVQVSGTTTSPGVQWQPLGPSPLLSDWSGFGYQDYGPVSGRVTSVAVDQKDATGNTVYVGAAYGGVWKSTNATALPQDVTWTQLIDNEATLAVGALAVKPDNGNVLLVGTGEPNNAGDSYYGLGILRSTDGGQTFSMIGDSADGYTFKGVGFSRFAWNTDNPNQVVAAVAYTARNLGAYPGNTYRGLYYSNDAGASWRVATIKDGSTTLGANSVTSVVYNAATKTYFAAVRPHGFYSSQDGVNWTRLAIQPGGSKLDMSVCPSTVAISNVCPMYRGELAVTPGRNEIYAWYVSIGNEADAKEVNQGVYVSFDNGASWTAIDVASMNNCGDDSGCGVTQGLYNLTMAAVPTATGTDIYAGAVNLFKCSLAKGSAECNGGWLNTTHVYGCEDMNTIGALAHVHPDQHAIDFSLANPSIIYFGNDGGIYRTLNGSGINTNQCTGHNDFDNLNQTIGSLTQFVWFSQATNSDLTIIGGTQDNGSPSLNPTVGSTWRTYWGGDGGWTAINPNNPDEWFVSQPYTKILRCTSGTGCQDRFSTVVNPTKLGGDKGAFYTPFILDPKKPSKLIVGTCRVWRGNTDGTGLAALSGVTNASVRDDFSSCDPNKDYTIRSLAAGGPVTDGGSQVIYAGTVNGEIWVTENADGGVSTWKRSTGVFANGNPISSITIDPSDPTGKTAIATVMGFGGGHVLRTTDAGAWWSEVGYGLPNAPADAFAFDPNNSSTWYVGTDVGVFVKSPDSPTWIEWGNLPNVAITRLEPIVTSTQSKLRVSTYGRGIWEIPLAGSMFTMTLNPDFADVAAGGTTKFQGVLKSSSYTAPVTISCVADKTPAPAICVPVTVTPTASGVAFTIEVGSSTVGTYNFALQAKGSDENNFSVTTSVTLRVSDFTLTVPNPSLRIRQGGFLQIPVRLVPVGSPGSLSITLRVTDLPPNSFSGDAGSSVWGDTARDGWAYFSSSYGGVQTAPGTYSMTITAQAGNAPAKTSPVTVTVYPEFDVSANIPSLMPGMTVTGNLRIAATKDYAGSISASCGTVPQGLMCSVPATPISQFPAEVPITLTASASATPSYQTVTVSATDGTLSHSTTAGFNLFDFGLRLPSPTAAVRGSSTPIDLTVISKGGFYDNLPATCSIDGVQGATCSVAPLRANWSDYLIPGAVTVSIPSTAAVGSTATLTVNATSTTFPSQTRSATTSVQVVDFAQSVSPTSAKAVLGSTATYHVTYTVQPGFKETVTPGCAFTNNYWFTCSGQVTKAQDGTPQSADVTVTTYPYASTGKYDGKITSSFLGATASTPVSLTLTDFGINTGSVSTLTATRGSSATVNVAVTSTSGHTDPVTLSCSNLPAQTTCTFSPAAPLPGETSKLTITTTAPSQAERIPSVAKAKYYPWTFALILPGIAIVGIRGQRRWTILLLLALTLALIATMAACGGGGSGGGGGTPITPPPTPPPPTGGTPLGNTLMTITGTSGGATRTVNVYLTVQ